MKDTIFDKVFEFAESLRNKDVHWNSSNVEMLCNPEDTYLIDKQDYEDLLNELKELCQKV